MKSCNESFIKSLLLYYCSHYKINILGLNDEEVKKIRDAINRASSLEEVERLQKILQSGQIPGSEVNGSK